MTTKPGMEKVIVEYASELGFERCGIIRPDAMKGFGEKLMARFARFPEMEAPMAFLRSAANPKKTFPWAQSVVVCSWRYGIYRVPENLNGRIGKSYLFDARRDEKAAAWHAGAMMERFLSEDLGLRMASKEAGNTIAHRWAALQAGLGTIRRNNFFYGDHGSYYSLQVFLTDADLEFIHKPPSASCSDDCNLCVKNCPTRSLAEPYAMNRMTCVSQLTTWENEESVFDRHGAAIGRWIYGCDICQDVCPLNKGKLSGEAEFPGLNELSSVLPLEEILTMDYERIGELLSAKFWYIGKNDVWKWKRNVLNAMKNEWRECYDSALRQACTDDDERVRARAMNLSMYLEDEARGGM